MSPPVALATRRKAARAGLDVAAIVAVLAVVIAALVLQPFIGGPKFVSRITFENPTPYDLTIEAASDPDDGWVKVGSARRAGASTVEKVVDQGDRWTFRFSVGGTEGGRLELDRAGLEEGDWTVEIPPSVEEQLRRSGVPVSP